MSNHVVAKIYIRDSFTHKIVRSVPLHWSEMSDLSLETLIEELEYTLPANQYVDCREIEPYMEDAA